MRILADVNISPRVVAALRADGFDAVRVSDIMPATSSDEEILAAAVRLGAVLISQDQDFSALLAISGATQPSHVNLRVTFVDADRLARTIATAMRAAADDLLAGAIITIDDARVRVHRLPVGRS
jgi:predicted nuclease of predicted toxin-antitoxin system